LYGLPIKLFDDQEGDTVSEIPVIYDLNIFFFCPILVIWNGTKSLKYSLFTPSAVITPFSSILASDCGDINPIS